MRHGSEIILRLRVGRIFRICESDSSSPSRHFRESRRWRHGEEMKWDMDVARSVTGLAKDPQASRHRYRVSYWTSAVAHTPAPRLSAFGHRCCSCPAAAAPLRWPAKVRSPACGLQAATVSGAPQRQRLRPWLISPAIAVSPAPTFTLHELSRVLPAACAVGDETARGFGCYAGIHSVFAALNCTKPDRGKSQAIEHNRALPKAGQSLRWLRLVACRCAPFGFG